MKIIPYINLTGNAEEAMNFYKDVFGGTIEIMRWSEMPPDPKIPLDDAWRSKVMHGTLSIRDDVTVFLSDSLMEADSPFNNNVFIHVVFDSEAELRKSFEALSAGGQVNMPVQETFWGSVYGDLRDKYGITWGLDYEIQQ